MASVDVNELVKPLLLRDLRVECRARGISPAGAREVLADRLKENMLVTNDFSLKGEGEPTQAGSIPAPAAAPAMPTGGNNYHRANGQNCGNFLTDRPSSRVLAPSGGGASQISFGNDVVDKPAAKVAHGHMAPVAAAKAPAAQSGPARADHMGGAASANDSHTNNYHRSGGQNRDNFITDRPSSRVLGPPGGQSQISFG
ncbi:hypothetical protein WJX73_003421 [Symbiochloris irregularis]|uniref:SAP domain-containing protein n=1 Tax=Symbiochloris irregularis TaxID=706552 RepID=A0AAW1PL16_9CHLO